MSEGFEGLQTSYLIGSIEVELTICLGLYFCKDCEAIHFIEVPTELQ